MKKNVTVTQRRAVAARIKARSVLLADQIRRTFAKCRDAAVGFTRYRGPYPPDVVKLKQQRDYADKRFERACDAEARRAGLAADKAAAVRNRDLDRLSERTAKALDKAWTADSLDGLIGSIGKV